MNDTINQPLVRTRGLGKTYGKRVALTGVDLDLNPGQIVGLLGENGCGKTTLLKTLAGVLAGYDGDVA
ncbi:MAG: ATP-binding cassette domain-containing protein, partial [Corynebacterium sp.]